MVSVPPEDAFRPLGFDSSMFSSTDSREELVPFCDSWTGTWTEWVETDNLFLDTVPHSLLLPSLGSFGTSGGITIEPLECYPADFSLFPLFPYSQYMLGHGQSTTTPEINSFRASMTLAPLPIQANVDDIDYGCDIGIASFLPNSSPSTMCCRRGDIGSQVRAAQRLDSRDVLSSSASQAIRSAASFCSPLSPLSNVASCSGLALEIDRAWGYSDSDKFDQQLTDVAATSLNHPRDIQTHGYLNERQEFSTTDFLGLSSVTTHVKFREFEDLHAIFRVSRKPDQESFLKGVLQSEFYYKDLMEPKENCRSTCRGSSTIGVGMGGSRDERSIYYRLVEKVKVKYKWWYKCCVCGELKSTSGRALGCVRSDLNHRPYVCQGSPMGCIKCPGYDGFAQFFTRALLVDHLKGQAKKVECVECQRLFRRGGMKRHWRSMHRELTFPTHVYPKYTEDAL